MLVGTSLTLLTDHVILNSQDLEVLANIHDDEGVIGNPIPPPREVLQDADQQTRARLQAELQSLRDRLVAKHPGLAYWIQMLSPPEIDAYIIGGVGHPPRTQPTDASTSRAQRTPSDYFFYAPSDTEVDTIVACLQKVIHLETKRWLPPVHIQIVALLWTKQALKQGYLVAGISLHDLADDFNMSGREFVEKYWDTDQRPSRAPPTLLVVAISCIFDIDVAVVDEQGVRPDGLIRPTKWRLKLINSRWQLWCKAEALDFISYGTLSTTEPFEIPSSQPRDQDVYIQGGAPKRSRTKLGRFARASRTALLRPAPVTRHLTLHVARGNDLHVTYQDTISTQQLLKYYAKAKRVGVAHVVLSIDMYGTWHDFAIDSPEHLTRNWDDYTLVAENRRAIRKAATQGPSEEQIQQYHTNLERQLAPTSGVTSGAASSSHLPMHHARKQLPTIAEEEEDEIVGLLDSDDERP
eukprot:6485558-Amphidinium_carterae.1